MKTPEYDDTVLTDAAVVVHADRVSTRFLELRIGTATASRHNAGFTLLELLVVIAVISIVSGMAIPSLLRGRAAGNETSAIASLRVVSTAQFSYALTCGMGFYAVTFPTLAVGPFGTPGYLSDDLGSSVTPIKNGYSFTMAPGDGGVEGPPDCNGSPNTNMAYYVTAAPVTPGATGVRAFAVNQGGAIWQDESGVPPAEPFDMVGTATPVQ